MIQVHNLKKKFDDFQALNGVVGIFRFGTR